MAAKTKDFKLFSRREKLTYLKAIADNAAQHVQQNPSEWRTFLRFYAKLYKYPFSEALLIYEQAPTATACGEIKHWNAVHRRVQRGTKGIPIISTADRNMEIRYVFDAADTYGEERGIPKQWRLPDMHIEAVVSEILNRFHIASPTDNHAKNLKWAVEQYTREFCADDAINSADVAGNTHNTHDEPSANTALVDALRDNVKDSTLATLDDTALQEAYIATVVDSVGYCVCERLTLPKGIYDTEEAFAHLHLFNSNAALTRLGSISGQISRSVLTLIARTIQTERMKNHDEHTAVHNQGSNGSAVDDGRGNRGAGEPIPAGRPKSADGEIRQPVLDLPQGQSPRPSRTPASGNEPARPVSASGEGSQNHDGNHAEPAARENAAPEGRLYGNGTVRNDDTRPIGGSGVAGNCVQAEIDDDNVIGETEAAGVHPSLSVSSEWKLAQDDANAEQTAPDIETLLFPDSLPSDNYLNDKEVFDAYVEAFAEQVKADTVYQDACRSGNEENILLECGNAVARVMTLFGINDAQLYDAFHNSAVFRQHLTESIFVETYEALSEDVATVTGTDATSAEEIATEAVTDTKAVSTDDIVPINSQPANTQHTNSIQHQNYRAFAALAPEIMDGETRYIRFTAGDGFMPLSVDMLSDNRISIAHNYEQNGDLMADPDMEFVIDREQQTLSARTYQQDSTGLFQSADDGSGGGNSSAINNPQLAQKLDSFARQWFSNIKAQGYHKESMTILSEDEEIELVAPQAFTPKQESLYIRETLLHGAVTNSGARRIYDYFLNTEATGSAISSFLAKEYGTSGHSIQFSDGARGFADYGPQGMKIWFTLEGADIRLSWAQVAGELHTLVKNGEYLPELGVPKQPQISLFELASGTEPPQAVLPVADMPTSTTDNTVSDLNLFDDTNADNDNNNTHEINGDVRHNGHTPNQDDAPVVAATTAPQLSTPRPPNLHFTPDLINILGSGGAKTKYTRNITAIRTLKQIESENRFATPNEQTVLAQYAGWGGISQAFSETHSDWQAEYTELKELLAEKEYRAAKGSTLNAHYTAPDIIDGIYKGLERLGFSGGNILEPSMGTGNFYGSMPVTMSESSRLYGVELDAITGRIAQQLYPQANIQIAGFESAALQDNFFDAAISNVPFGAYHINDPKYDKHKLYIHDYFIAKALDKVRPGGVIAFITTKGTMDKANNTVRRFLAERAELLGAIRLPNTAHKASAGTEVTTDILFLKKRDRLMLADDDMTQGGAKWIYTGKTQDGVPLNEYFIENPHMMLGTMVFDRSMYGNEAETALHPFSTDTDTRSLREQLMQAVSFLPADAVSQMADLSMLDMDSEESDDEAMHSNHSLPADPSVKNFCYALTDNGDIYQRNDSRMAKCSFSKTAAERVKSMIAMRMLTRDILTAQLDGINDDGLHTLQNRLNTAYDKFYKRFGAINSRYNRNLFGDDADFPLLSSIEELKDDGSTIKSAVFTQRTIFPTKAITHADTASEALAVSLNERGNIDIAFMAELCGKTYDEVVTDLHGVIFKNPAVDNPAYGDPDDESGLLLGWETADEYLSGRVKDKLAAAELAAQENPMYAVNAEALRAVQPKPLEAHEITVRIGAHWVEAQYYRQFLLETMQPADDIVNNIQVHYSRRTGEWSVEKPSTHTRGNSIEATKTYGTSRMDAYTLFEVSLNQKNARIYDKTEENGKERRVLNHRETIAIRERQSKLREVFRKWIFNDPVRREELCAVYNNLFNSERQRKYDGSHLTFPGMSPEIKLREHQRDAVARGLYGGNSLLAHVVGSGKTYTMTAIAMEMKRLNLAQKPCLVVPNHLVGQWANEFQRLYPTANILAATRKDFEKHKRRRFCARIATGDWDAVIIGHSSFEKIPMSVERQEQRMRRDINEIESAIIESKHDKNQDITVKELERTLRNMEFQLKKLQDAPKDNLVTFEELGIDALFVDEAHFYKNKFIFTKMTNVAGLSRAHAKKSTDMDMKCEYVNETNNAPRGVVFATGTPVSNSMTELYTTMSYLMREELERVGLQHFDNWAATYGEVVSALELAPSGQSYRMKERFAKFVNLPELMSMFRKVADIQTSDMLDLNVPTIQNGKPTTIAVDPTPEQKIYTEFLVKRAERIQRREVQPSEDNMLCVTNDGRKAALDMRCLDLNAANEGLASLALEKNQECPPILTTQDYPDSKVNVCVQNVFAIYQETEKQKLAQMVFCDLSTPKNGASFSVYDDIKAKLMGMGVQESEVAFIHDANTDEQKEKIFSAVRSGNIRIILGSTQKMGAGTNAQTKLIALHHLDCPYRPSDLEQREGRIVRQGNENKEVRIFQYVTKNSFDAYLWQIVESKQKFISQVMSGKNPSRVMDDIDEMVLNYAEVKAIATGNPMIKRKMELDLEVQRLRILEAQYQADRYSMEDNVLKHYPAGIAVAREAIKNIEADIARRDEHIVHIEKNHTPNAIHNKDSESADSTIIDKNMAPSTNGAGAEESRAFYMRLGKHEYTERTPAGEMLLKAIQSNQYADKAIGSYCGFTIIPQAHHTFDAAPRIELKGARSYTLELSGSAVGSITRIENAIRGLEAALHTHRGKLTNLQRQITTSKLQLEQPFEQMQELQMTLAELETVNAALDVGHAEEDAVVADEPSEDVLGLEEEYEDEEMEAV